MGVLSGLVLAVLLLTAVLNLAVQHGAELLFLVGVHHLGGELVYFLGEVEDLHAVVLQSLDLGHLVDGVDVLAGGVVDDLLVLLHAGDVLVQAHQLLLRGGPEQH